MWLADIIPFGHHSNGQNGCLFTSQARDVNGDCVEIVPPQPPAINKIDGSFSTNYVEATLHYGRLHLDSDEAPEGEDATRWEWRAGAGFQLNPKGYVGGSIDDELSAIYGPTRVIFEGMAARRGSWRCGRLQADLRVQYIHDAPDSVPDATTQAEVACFPARWGGAGLFARFYHRAGLLQPRFRRGDHPAPNRIHPERQTFLSFRIRPQ